GDRVDLPLEVLDQILAPLLLAAVVHTHKDTLAAQGEDQLAVYRGRTVGTERPDVAIEVVGLRNGGGPELLAVFVERDPMIDRIVLAAEGAEEVAPLADDGGTAVAEADRVRGPGQGRSLGWPGFEQARLRGDVVALRPAPLRPVGGLGRPRQSQSRHEHARS